MLATPSTISVQTVDGFEVLNDQGDNIPTRVVRKLCVPETVAGPVAFVVYHRKTSFLWTQIPALAKGEHLYLDFVGNVDSTATGTIAAVDTGKLYPLTAVGLSERNTKKRHPARFNLVPSKT